METPDIATLLAFTLLLKPIPLAAFHAPGSLEALQAASSFALRVELVESCAAATDDAWERFVCAKIPLAESGYEENVATCEKKSRAGAVSAWQIVPLTSDDKLRLCRSVGEDAKVAIERIRQSRQACRTLPKNEQLGIYTYGRCDSEEGRRLSRARWPTEREIYAAERLVGASR